MCQWETFSDNSRKIWNNPRYEYPRKFETAIGDVRVQPSHMRDDVDKNTRDHISTLKLTPPITIIEINQ